MRNKWRLQEHKRIKTFGLDDCQMTVKILSDHPEGFWEHDSRSACSCRLLFGWCRWKRILEDFFTSLKGDGRIWMALEPFSFFFFRMFKIPTCWKVSGLLKRRQISSSFRRWWLQILPPCISRTQRQVDVSNVEQKRDFVLRVEWVTLSDGRCVFNVFLQHFSGDGGQILGKFSSKLCFYYFFIIQIITNLAAN